MGAVGFYIIMENLSDFSYFVFRLLETNKENNSCPQQNNFEAAF